MLPLVVIALAHGAELTVPATGRQSVVYEAESFGRYAFEVASPSGTSVQLVDRMTGPGRTDGRPGGEDGRIDTFLDRGGVQARLVSPVDGTGEATLTVTRFARVGDSPILPQAEQLASTLTDRHERAWWVDIDERAPFAVEVVGRFVGDVRLWQHGTWLVDASPRCGTVEPAEGQPLTRCVLSTTLEPDLYQLVVYGGPGKPWSEAGDGEALHVRWDVPWLGPAGREPRVIGPTGTDRFWLPEGPDFAQVDLPEVAPVALSVMAAAPGGVFGSGGQRATIDDESRVPTASVQFSSDDPAVLSVTGAPGQAYTLTWFPRVGGAIAAGRGDALLTTLHAAHPDDIPVPTPLVYRRVDPAEGPPGITVVAQGALPVGPRVAHRERFNLLATTSILLEVTNTGRYRFATSGVPTTLRVQPFFVTRPEGYEPPGSVLDEWDDRLDAGLHVLEITPVEQGIVELEVAPNGWTDWAREAVGRGPADALPRPELQHLLSGRWGPLRFAPSGLPDVPRGYALRSLPVDPTASVPVALRPGESWPLPIEVHAPGMLEAVDEHGEPLEVVVDDVARRRHRVEPGRYAAAVSNRGDTPVRGALRFVPDPRPPAPLPSGRLDALPDFPELTADRRQPTDLDRDERETWAVTVAEPGLYRLQSTGLLATSGVVRTRTRLGLASGNQNGIGRNFVVARYLRSGDYQLTVGPEGRSAGHAGLVLDRTTLEDGGVLHDGVTARVSLKAGDAVAYRFEVAETGRYAVTSQGRGRSYRCRLEDADGFPVLAPDLDCDLDVTLDPGTYTLVGLPEQVATRRLTTVTRAVEPVTFAGHGPHPLALGVAASHVWSEPTDDGAERTPDRWSFTLPARTRVTLGAGEEMAGVLRRGDDVVERIVPGRSLVTTIDPGAYVVELRGARRSTGVPYTVSVTPRDLVVNVRREVSLPARETVAIGEAGFVLVGSSGGVDTRARLLAPDGAVVATSDDRPDDWNFLVAAWLEPGRYTLEAEPVGGSGRTTLDVRRPTQRTAELTAPGRTLNLEASSDAHVLPLALSDAADLVHVVARSRETVAVALEVSDGEGGWRALGTALGRTADLWVRRPHGAETRARVWTLDGGANPLEVTVDAPRPRAVREPALAAGTGAPAGVRVPGDRPGLFAFRGSRRGVLACPERGVACAPAPAVVPLTEDGLVLVGAEVRAERLELTDAVPVTLADRALAVDVPAGDAAAVVVRGATAQPGVSFGGPMAVGDNAALAVALDGERRARVWRASGAPDALEARVTAHVLERAPSVAAVAGRQSWVLPPHTVRPVSLPPDGADLAVTLEAGAAATVGDRMAWADGDARVVQFTRAGTLALVNPTAEERLVSADVVPPGDDRALSVDAPLERLHATAGSLVRRVAGDDAGVLHVRGADATYVRDDGEVFDGDGAPVGPGGVLELRWAPGPVLAWVAGDRPGPTRDVTIGRTAPVTGATRVPLAGDAVALAVTLGSPRVLHVGSESPFVAEINGGEQIIVRERGGTADVWLPAGTGRVLLRALAGTALFGTATVTTSEVVTLGEGLGPEVLLPPGGSRWFRFTADREGPIGVGVRASADRVTARVVSPDGAVAGEGVVRRVALTPGEWLLVLEQPADAAPVRARPAIAGLDAPDTGPPDDVVRSYLELAGLGPGGDR